MHAANPLARTADHYFIRCVAGTVNLLNNTFFFGCLADLDIFMYVVVLYMEMLRCGYMMDASLFVCRGIGRTSGEEAFGPKF
jgi:hypothetical protein